MELNKWRRVSVLFLIIWFNNMSRNFLTSQVVISCQNAKVSSLLFNKLLNIYSYSVLLHYQQGENEAVMWDGCL